MAKPISVPPSQYWEGDDGPWSSFSIQVGTPPQALRVFASTTVPETWVVDKQGCTKQDPTNCKSSRGNVFNVNASSTWTDEGLYALGVEMNLPYTSNYDAGDYGFDTLGLGLPGSGDVSLPGQVIATVATKDFYLGNLGLTPRPVNFSSFVDSKPSFLSSLREQNEIPSLSFGYNAGAEYRLKKVEGSLTLGGYDASRFTPNDVTFNFAPDVSRDLVVGLQSIQFTDSRTTDKELLPSGGILSFIDSTIPHIWLPVAACKAFENAFGLTYDNQTDLYLVNDTLHNALTQQDAQVSFILGNAVQGGQTVNITFPYAAFDLQVTSGQPGINSTQLYFPIRRAANDSQYTLGRTFLQESYLTVDYERSIFRVQQALWQENASQNLTSVLSINATTPTRSKTPALPSRKLSTGAVVGIVVGAIVLCLLIVGAGVFCFWRKRKQEKRKKSSPEPDIHEEKAEADGTSPSKPMELGSDAKGPGEFPGDGNYYSPDTKLGGAEVEGSPAPSNRAEVQGTPGGVEMEGSRGGVEMEGSGGGVEMEGEGSPRAEMDGRGQHQYFELPANDHLDPRPSRGTSRRARDRINSNPRFSWRRSRAEDS